MKRIYLSLGALALATAAVAQTSYDSITGQSYPYYYSIGSYQAVADDTMLANLDPVQSIDILVVNPSTATVGTFDLTMNVYDSSGSTGASSAYGGPGTALATGSAVVNLAAGFYEDLTFNFATPWVPTTQDIWTSVSITGDSVAGLMIPGANPTVGTSSNSFDIESGGTWGNYWFGGTPTANFAFRYNGVPTPEPISMAFLGLGVVGLVARRRARS